MKALLQIHPRNVLSQEVDVLAQGPNAGRGPAAILAALGYIHISAPDRPFSARLLAGEGSWAHTLKGGLPHKLESAAPFGGLVSKITRAGEIGYQRVAPGWLIYLLLTAGCAVLAYLRLFR